MRIVNSVIAEKLSFSANCTPRHFPNISTKMLDSEILESEYTKCKEEKLRLELAVIDLNQVNKRWQKYNGDMQQYIKNLLTTISDQQEQINRMACNAGSSLPLARSEDGELSSSEMLLRGKLIHLQREVDKLKTEISLLQSQVDIARSEIKMCQTEKLKPETSHHNLVERQLHQLTSHICHHPPLNLSCLQCDFGSSEDFEESESSCGVKVTDELPHPLNINTDMKTPKQDTQPFTCPMCKVTFPPDSDSKYLDHLDRCPKR